MKNFLLVVLLFSAHWVAAQTGNLTMHPIVEAWYTDSIMADKTLHTAIKPYRKEEIRADWQARYQFPFVTDSHTWNSLLNGSMATYTFKGRELVINPIYTSELGPIYTAAFDYDKDRKFKVQDMQLGIRAHTDLSAKLSIDFMFRFTNWTAPQYLLSTIEQTRVIPHVGHIKNGDSFGFAAYDWQGCLSYSPTRYFNLQMGRGKQFIGDGYRSILLSDNAPAREYLKATLTLGKVKYQMLVTRNQDINRAVTDVQYSTKYIINHILSYNATRWLNLYFMETVIQQARDSVGYRGLDVNYLNPVAFLRPVEFNLGSPDNALIGFGGSLRLGKHYQVYGQFLLDELIIGELTADRGWWGNKYALQAGLKATSPFGLRGLMLQAEGNMARPYTYSHDFLTDAYGNLHSPLAHPLGANFVELLAHARYQRGRIGASVLVTWAQKGLDTEGKNYGGDIYKDYDTRTVPDDQRYIPPHWEGTEDFGHRLLQGLLTTYRYHEARVYFVLNPRIGLIAEAGLRSNTSSNTSLNQHYTYGFFGIRTLIDRPVDDH